MKVKPEDFSIGKIVKNGVKANRIIKSVGYGATFLKMAKEGVDMQVKMDPYYQHMPKDDIGKAIGYSIEIGGEYNEISSSCDIF